MTPSEYTKEFNVTRETRLGELCGAGTAEPWMIHQAKSEAEKHCNEVNEQDKN